MSDIGKETETSNRNLDLRSRIQDLKTSIIEAEREREREQKLVNSIGAGCGGLVFFTIGAFWYGTQEGSWIAFVLLSVISALVLFLVIRKLSKVSKLSKKIENYKKQIKNLKNSIR